MSSHYQIQPQPVNGAAAAVMPLITQDPERVIDARLVQPYFWRDLYRSSGLFDVLLSEDLISRITTLYEVPGITPDQDVELDQVVREVHRRVNNYQPRPEDKLLFAGGSTQVVYTILHVLARQVGRENITVVEQAPYYDNHRDAAVEEDLHWVSSQDATEEDLENKFVIEFVTSPNNPDGRFREPACNITPHVIIADLVFDWPWNVKGPLPDNQAWIDEYRRKGTLVFVVNSFSKSFGLAGQRCGYVFWPLDYDRPVSGLRWKKDAWVFKRKDPLWEIDSRDLLEKAYLFIDANTLGVTPDGHLACRAAGRIFLDRNERILMVLNTIQRALEFRRAQLTEALAKHGFVVTGGPLLPTLWGKFTNGRNAERYFRRRFSTLVRGGKPEGATKAFARINLLLTQQDFETLLARIQGDKK